MNRIFLSLLLLALFFTGCKKDSSVDPQAAKDDAAFTVYEQTFLDALWKQNPDWATAEGYHKYDSLLLVPSSKNIDKSINFDKVHLDSLNHYDVTVLSESSRIDYYLMQNQLQYSQWQLNQLHTRKSRKLLTRV